MDPLSITASVFALAGAVSAAVSRVQAALEAPKEVIALANDIADFEVVLGEVLTSGLSTSRWVEKKSSRGNDILALLRRAEEKLKRLHQILEEKLGGQDDSTGGQAAMAKQKKNKRSYAKVGIAWLKWRGEVEDLRRDLLGVKLSLVAVVGAATSVNVAEILLRLEEVEIMPKEKSESHRESLSCVSVADDGCNGKRESSTATPNEGTLVAEAASRSQATGRTEQAIVPSAAENMILRSVATDPSSIVRVSASRSGCPKWCSCVCHKPGRIKSPHLLNQILGAVSVGYTGLPFLSSPCNEKLCRPRKESSTRITYQFPAWFLARSISMAISSSTAGPELILRTLRILPSTSDVFRLAQNGDLNEVKALFSKGQASIYDVDINNWSILHKAFLVGQKEVCEFLLDAGADPHISADNNSSVVERAWHFDRTGTGSEGNLAIVHNQIFKRVDIEELAETQQYTIIHKIVLGLSHLDLAQQLEISTATIDQPDSRQRTALWWASARGDERAVRLLLAHGASIHLGSKSHHGVVHVAQTPGVVKALLEYGAEVGCRDEKGRTPLHACSYRGRDRGGNSDLLECLLEGGANVNARTYAGHTPLHYAAAYGLVELLPLLLVHGAHIESRRNDGFTPLMLAILSNEPRAAKVLLQNGADHTALDSHGRTIIHLCAMNGNVSTMKALVAAQLDGISPEQKDLNGLTARNHYDKRKVRLESADQLFDELIHSLQPLTNSSDEEVELEIFEDAVEGFMAEPPADVSKA